MKDKFMKIAILEAEKAYNKGEVPIGAVIVKDDKIISKSHNMVEKKKSAIYHAEIIAIKKASKKLKNWRLNQCDMYVTLEPCPMCKGAINKSRIRNIYYSTSKQDDSSDIFHQKYINLFFPETTKMLKEFFDVKRKK